MRIHKRIPKSFTLDDAVVSYVQRTRGRSSASERVNELLRRAILDELYDRLDKEAAKFFVDVSERERKETRAFYRASRKSAARHGFFITSPRDLALHCQSFSTNI